MSNYWPAGVEITDVQSPGEILKSAQDEWKTNGKGIMELVLQDTESESGNPITIVHAKHVPSSRTARLFSVVHRPNKPYPVTIQTEDENLPNFLKKSYYRTNITDTALQLGSVGGVSGQISNKWVSDTPSEFREKLAEAFNLGSVTSLILNLASDSASTSGDHPVDAQHDLAENPKG